MLRREGRKESHMMKKRRVIQVVSHGDVTMTSLVEKNCEQLLDSKLQENFTVMYVRVSMNALFVPCIQYITPKRKSG